LFLYYVFGKNEVLDEFATGTTSLAINFRLSTSVLLPPPCISEFDMLIYSVVPPFVDASFRYWFELPISLALLLLVDSFLMVVRGRISLAVFLTRLNRFRGEICIGDWFV